MELLLIANDALLPEGQLYNPQEPSPINIPKNCAILLFNSIILNNFSIILLSIFGKLINKLSPSFNSDGDTILEFLSNNECSSVTTTVPQCVVILFNFLFLSNLCLITLLILVHPFSVHIS